MQSRRMTLVEVITDQLLGVVIAVLINKTMYGGSFTKALSVTLIFTAASILRRYFHRRFFVWLEFKGMQ